MIYMTEKFISLQLTQFEFPIGSKQELEEAICEKVAADLSSRLINLCCF